MSIKKITDLINENSTYKLVYDENKKVLGCNLTNAEVEKIKAKVKEVTVKTQISKFKTLEDAQKALDMQIGKQSSKLNDEVATDPTGKKLIQIANAVSARFPRITKGAYYYFLELIGKTFDHNKFLFISKIPKSEHVNDVIEAYVVAGKYLYDINGFHSLNSIMEKHKKSKWSFSDYAFYEDGEFLEQVSNKYPSDTPLEKHEQEELDNIVKQIKG